MTANYTGQLTDLPEPENRFRCEERNSRNSVTPMLFYVSGGLDRYQNSMSWNFTLTSWVSRLEIIRKWLPFSCNKNFAYEHEHMCLQALGTSMLFTRPFVYSSFWRDSRCWSVVVLCSIYLVGVRPKWIPGYLLTSNLLIDGGGVRYVWKKKMQQ